MNAELHVQPLGIKHFRTEEIPIISISEYMDRIKKYCRVDNYEMAHVHIYIGRLIDKGVVISHYNIYNITISCLVLAVKYLHDLVYSNKYYALVGGIDLKILNTFELEMAVLLDWNFGLKPKTYLHTIM
jgi:hypothetical protein